jgi:hypothetical protein
VMQATTFFHVLNALLQLWVVLAVLIWLVRLARGRVAVRDERGRLRPGFAAVACIAALVVVGGLVGLVQAVT